MTDYKKRPELNSPAYNNSFYLNKHIDFLESQNEKLIAENELLKKKDTAFKTDQK